LFGQNVQKWEKTDEMITKQLFFEGVSDRFLFNPIGRSNDHRVFIYENLKTHKMTLYKLSEEDQTLLDVQNDYNNFLSRYHSNHKLFGQLLFVTKLNFESPDDYGYYDLEIANRDNVYLLDSIYNADKLIHTSFSTDGKFLLVNTLNTLSDYYNPEQDNRIMVYDLSEMDNGEIKREYIPCDKCSDGYLINDQLFFTIGRKDGYSGYSNKDIYVAPWGNLQDTVKIASNTKIISISPDGKYVLGSRFFDTQKNTCVIIDVESKKYQMLLGRDYYKAKAFYSYYEEKFAFDFKGYLIYVDMPEKFPFNALNWKNEEIPDWTEEEFWKQFEHKPLPKE